MAASRSSRTAMNIKWRGKGHSIAQWVGSMITIILTETKDHSTAW